MKVKQYKQLIFNGEMSMKKEKDLIMYSSMNTIQKLDQKRLSINDDL